jgi:hypothetical protein
MVCEEWTDLAKLPRTDVMYSALSVIGLWEAFPGIRCADALVASTFKFLLLLGSNLFSLIPDV